MRVFDKYLIPLSAAALLICSCGGKDDPTRPVKNHTAEGDGFTELVPQTQDIQLAADTIPDFSRVGYHYGDDSFPDYANVVQLPSPEEIGGDATEVIQSAIDNAPYGSVIQFRPGRYIVDGLLIVDRDGIILRGAPDLGTEIFARGTVPIEDVPPTSDSSFFNCVRPLINIGVSKSERVVRTSLLLMSRTTIRNTDDVLIEDHSEPWRVAGLGLNSAFSTTEGEGSNIVEDAFCGSSFVTVHDASAFSPGQDVVVYRPGTQKWIDDLQMSAEYLGEDGCWKPDAYSMRWERKVKAVVGNRIYFDIPLVMSVTSEYGGGVVRPCNARRVRECGVENLKLISDYNEDRNYIVNGREVKGDVYHAVSAIVFYGAEHCWVKNVETWYFSESAVAIAGGAKNISVQDCCQQEPAGYVIGGLRYAFHISAGQQSIVRDCESNFDRHQFVTGPRVPGPNVFLYCEGKNAYADVGPHQRWATGTLYDHVATNATIAARNTGLSGTGHGWQGTNQVFWSCSAGAGYDVKSPFVTGNNYWIDGGSVSLYESQRRKDGQ